MTTQPMTPDTQHPAPIKKKWAVDLKTFKERMFRLTHATRTEEAIHLEEILINAYEEVLAERDMLRSFTLAFHGADEPRKPIPGIAIFAILPNYGNRIIHFERDVREEISGHEGDSNYELIGIIYESDLLRAFEAHLKQKGAANATI